MQLAADSVVYNSVYVCARVCVPVYAPVQQTAVCASHACFSSCPLEQSFEPQSVCAVLSWA